MKKIQSVTMLQLTSPQQAIEVIGKLGTMIRAAIDTLNDLAQASDKANGPSPLADAIATTAKILSEELAEVMKTCSIDLPAEKMEQLKALAEKAKGASPEEMDALVKETMETIGMEAKLATMSRGAVKTEEPTNKIQVKGSTMLH